MKSKITLLILVFIFSTVYVQSQSLKQRAFKDKRTKSFKKLAPNKTNTPFVSIGNLYVTSNKTKVVSYFTLKENNQQGAVINGATIHVNNKIIKAKDRLIKE